MTTLLLVLVGGAAGSVLRLLLDSATRPGRRLPWGILAANVLGSLLLGLLGGSAPTWVAALAGTGFCGGLTTWSTLAVDTARMPRALGALNLGLNLLLGLTAAALGRWLAP